jgi:hypothetical protein
MIWMPALTLVLTTSVVMERPTTEKNATTATPQTAMVVHQAV